MTLTELECVVSCSLIGAFLSDISFDWSVGERGSRITERNIKRRFCDEGENFLLWIVKCGERREANINSFTHTKPPHRV